MEGRKEDVEKCIVPTDKGFIKQDVVNQHKKVHIK